MSAIRLEIPEGPAEPEAATTAPVSADGRVALKSGKSPASAAPTREARD